MSYTTLGLHCDSNCAACSRSAKRRPTLLQELPVISPNYIITLTIQLSKMYRSDDASLEPRPFGSVHVVKQHRKSGAKASNMSNTYTICRSIWARENTQRSGQSRKLYNSTIRIVKANVMSAVLSAHVLQQVVLQTYGIGLLSYIARGSF